MKRIGERIRKKRDSLNMQLNELARKSGISSSALSQIEKSKAFPSIITLKTIAENLHTTVGELIGENESLSNNPVVKKEDIKFLEKNDSGSEIYFLSHHDLNKHMDTYLVKFVKGSDISGFFKNNIGQFFCHVILGEIEFHLDNQLHILGSGDSIYFNSKSAYTAKNLSDNGTEIIMISSSTNS